MWQYNQTPDTRDFYNGMQSRQSGDALHYGVLGMKWGVRRANNLRNQNKKSKSKLRKQYSKIKPIKQKNKLVLFAKGVARSGTVGKALRLKRQIQSNNKKIKNIENKVNDSKNELLAKNTVVDKRISKFLKNGELKSAQKQIKNGKRTYIIVDKYGHKNTFTVE